MNEDQIVARLRTLFSDRIGDDAAVVGDLVFTTDMLIEDIDFTASTPVTSIARKSLAVNLSDVAAMGASPAFALASFAIPGWFHPHLDSFLDALAAYARDSGVEIVGGDLSRAEKLVISIVAAGRIQTRPLLRSGARPGDRIFVSRPVGASAAGLFLLQQGWTLDGEPPRDLGYAHLEFVRSAIRRHLEPEPETALGVGLAAISEVTSCIDVSDGLSTDLHRLCDASACGAVIERERIPVFPDLVQAAPALGIQARDVILHGGEDYALLFTASLREAELSALLRRPVYTIGRITSEREVVLRDGDRRVPLERGGWDHFA